MANKILVAADATPIVWAESGDYAGDGGARTHEITLAALGKGAARQGDKADLDTGGSVVNKFPAKFAITLRVEFDVAPATDRTVDVYWAASPSATVGTANPGGTTGEDGAYTGTAGSTLDESLKQLQFIGRLMGTKDVDAGGGGVVQQQTFFATLPTQYGSPVIHNTADEDLEGDDIEASLTFTPYEYEVQ